MHRFRATACLARLVLAWFALSLGVAMASPLVQPRALQLICGAGAVKLLLQQDDGQPPATALTLDCALCSPAVVPPPAAVSVALATLPPLPMPEAAAHENDVRTVLRPLPRGPPPGQPG
jgi:hypothetical protein